MSVAASRIAGHPEYRRVLKGAFLAPWSAVSIGVVIAAALTLTTPRAALTFPPSAGGQCAVAGCVGGVGGPSPAIKREVRLHATGRRKAGARLWMIYAGRVLHGVRVQYVLLPMRHDHFIAEVKITGRKPLGRWSLRLVLPGAHIEAIMWAKWEPDGLGGVIIDGSPLPWPRSGPNEARVAIFGTGSPGWPTGCVFDGASCTIRALAHRRQGMPNQSRWAMFAHH
ncbi:MAG TPA: hypothetical protein VNF47_16170 [Streptosporangiaceae bacterium]|nr:hypothetical protein [Streptosporangiaceae bacterium]